MIVQFPFSEGLWRNGSASDSRSDGWAFESLWPHFAFFHVEVTDCVVSDLWAFARKINFCLPVPDPPR